jgi:hypothetical protein
MPTVFPGARTARQPAFFAFLSVMLPPWKLGDPGSWAAAVIVHGQPQFSHAPR